MTRMYVLVVLGALVAFTSAECNRYTGPPGSTECVAFPRYRNVPQYATCLSDTYIRVKSGGKHQCRSSSATYCWYQCMCELNNNCDGPAVFDNCTCSTSSPAPQSTLHRWCFSPTGAQCSWYRDCLEKRYPCNGTDASYPITYANKFCDLYSSHYREFSSDGRRWIDAVRKCLQVELVPILRPWINKSCSDIKNMAFASHSKCYTSPASGVSYCTLSWRDKWQVFWTMKGAFVSAFRESVKGLWDTLSECNNTGNRDELSFENTDVAKAQLFVSRPALMNRDRDIFAGQIIEAIAKIEKWTMNGISLFGYSEDKHVKRSKREVTPSSFHIDILLASTRKYDLNRPSAPVVKVNETVTSLAQSVKNGLPRITVNGVRVKVLSMVACSNLNCTSTYLDVEAPATYPATGNAFRMSNWLVFLATVISIVHRNY